MELHHWAMLALIAVMVLAPKVGRTLTRRANERQQAQEQRRLAARRCERECRRLERRGEFMDSPPVLEESPMVTVLRRLREDKVAVSHSHSLDA